jgi:hypothetical protein
VDATFSRCIARSSMPVSTGGGQTGAAPRFSSAAARVEGEGDWVEVTVRGANVLPKLLTGALGMS